VNTQTVTATPFKKIAAITGFFAAVGPPLGYLVLIFVGGLVGSTHAAFTGRLLEHLIAGLKLATVGWILAIPFAYVFGIVPACLAGLIIGILHVYHRSNYFPVLAVGVCVGSGYAVALRTYLSNHVLPNQTQSLWPMALTCVATIFLCWRGVRNWYQEDLPLDGDRA
jgi:hypothetical protein